MSDANVYIDNFYQYTKKFGITFASMIVSAICYGFVFGFRVATGFVLLLFVHEIGHVIFAKWRKIESSMPIFIPFIGAIINVDEKQIKTPQDEAWLGIGGPLIGSLGVAIVFLVGIMLFPDSESLKKIVCIGTFLNLFNLLPIRPLDGGRVTQIIGKWTQFIGLSILIILSIFIFSPVFIVLWFFVIISFGGTKYRTRVSLIERFNWTIGYSMLFVTLFVSFVYLAQNVKLN